MSPARRSHRKRDWPRGLYEPRPGYYVWRHPETHKTFALGAIPLAHAKHQAAHANAHILAAQPSLVDRLSGVANSVAELLEKMPVAENNNTLKTRRSLDKTLRAEIGNVACADLTVKVCADMLEKFGSTRKAQALRSRLVAVCRKGMTLGWMESNPAETTETDRPTIQRGRLTLEAFRAIHARAAEVAEWLPHAMMLALITGCDRSTITGLQRADVADGYLTFTRPKTKARVAVPLALRMNCVGVSLAELVAHRTGVLSKLLVHHVNPWGNAPAGSKIHPDRISHSFTEARKLAGIPDAGAPTFHEIRSLCKRLFEEQGGVDTKALLGHKTERMSDLYADPRGIEPIRVRVG